MTREYLKKASLTSASGASDVHDAVVSILEDIKPGGDAKRILFGSVGNDMIAGPTDSLILADKTADPHIVATDLVSQAEHGYNSPVWLVTERSPTSSWRDYAEVIVCAYRIEMAKCSDE